MGYTIEYIENILYKNKKSSNYKENRAILEKYKHNLDYVLLKIICSTPLIYYKNIRESAFQWVISMLEELRIGNTIHGQKIDSVIGLENIKDENLMSYFEVNTNDYYSELQKLKFLLKRSVQLKSNYIIHIDFFNSIEKLINIIHKNYENCSEKKIDSDRLFLEKTNTLFEIPYPFLKKEALNYINDLDKSKLFIKGFFVSIFNKYTIAEIESEIEKYQVSNNGNIMFGESDKDNFQKHFQELKIHKKYRLTTSKKLIYELIALVQELIYDHETKAVKLEENINHIELVSSDEITNGNFNHYLWCTPIVGQNS